MVSIVLYILGIPLWMIIGMLLLAFWNRNRVKKQLGSFPVKVRPEPSSDAEKEPKWPRMTGYAQWVHDVLIVRTGMGLMMTTPYGIAAMDGPPPEADPKKVKGLGDLLRARQDDGSIVQVAVQDIHPDLAPERFQVDTE